MNGYRVSGRLAFWPWLVWVCACPFAAAQEEAAFRPAAPIRQSSHSPQPEGSGIEGVFSDPVACDVLVQYALANNPQVRAARYHARSLGARVPQAASLADPQLMTQLNAAIPLEGMAEPEEIANLVVWLASDQASYVTATTFFVDGGMMQFSPGL